MARTRFMPLLDALWAVASIDGDKIVHSTPSLSRLRSTKPHISPSWPRKQTAPDRIAAPKVLV